MVLVKKLDGFFVFWQKGLGGFTGKKKQGTTY
jgi:hypothetical protein